MAPVFALNTSDCLGSDFSSQYLRVASDCHSHCSYKPKLRETTRKAHQKHKDTTAYREPAHSILVKDKAADVVRQVNFFAYHDENSIRRAS